jgi:hypothetical protein
VKVEATYDFTAGVETQLSFAAGDTLTVLAKDNADWWRAKNVAGVEGDIPAAFVHEIVAKQEPIRCEALFDFPAELETQLPFTKVPIYPPFLPYHAQLHYITSSVNHQ